MKRQLLDDLLTARAKKIPCAVVTHLSSGRQTLYRQGDSTDAATLDPELGSAIGDALRQDCSQCIETRSGRVFVHVFNPPLRLVVVGAVHIAQALVPMAELVGYQVVVVDPRRSFASSDRFPGVALVDEWPDDAVTALVPDSRTALVTLTHDPKLDDPALIAGLRTPAFYMGSLGSRRTHRARLDRLRKLGCAESALARIHAPIRPGHRGAVPGRDCDCHRGSSHCGAQRGGKMKFGPVPPNEAQGALLAHSLRVSGSMFRKGRALGAGDVRALCRAGIEGVTVVRPEEGDLDENRAAATMAATLAGAGIACAATVNGRVKMYALEPGLAVIDERRVHELNAAGESVALATLAPLTRVDRGQVLATLKVLPLVLSRDAIDALAPHLSPSVSVNAFRPLRVGLLQSRVEGTRGSLLEKTVAGTKARVESLGGTLLATRCCEHHEAAVAEAISDLQPHNLDLLIVIGASATMDRRDCVPRGIEGAGGEVERLGMPVDPGHLTLLARCGDLPVLVAPGSARSSRRSSFDLLLERFAARVPVDSGSVAALGVGGLDKVMHVTPDAARITRQTPRVAALVLAAGQSRRMGPINKLLAVVDGAPMLARVVGEALESHACAVYVVTGYERIRVEEVLADRDVHLVHNPGFERGISSSIAAGLSSLPADVEGALICLGDMPEVSTEVLDRIVAAFDPGQGAEVCVPTHRGKRGNPVLWSRSFFAEICRIRGDAGARHLIGEHSDVVREVPIDDASVLLDVDSPEALARVSARQGTKSCVPPNHRGFRTRNPHREP